MNVVVRPWPARQWKCSHTPGARSRKKRTKRSTAASSGRVWSETATRSVPRPRAASASASLRAAADPMAVVAAVFLSPSEPLSRRVATATSGRSSMPASSPASAAATAGALSPGLPWLCGAYQDTATSPSMPWDSRRKSTTVTGPGRLAASASSWPGENCALPEMRSVSSPSREGGRPSCARKEKAQVRKLRGRIFPAGASWASSAVEASPAAKTGAAHSRTNQRRTDTRVFMLPA